MDQPSAGGIARWLALLGAGLAAALGGAWVLLRVFPGLQFSSRWAASFSAFIPAGIAAWAMAALAFAIAGRRRWVRLLAVPCVAALALQVSWTVPYWPHAAPVTSGTALRVLTLNTMFGKADPGESGAIIAEEQPDLIVFNEIQQPLVDRLKATGALAEYPYQVGTIPPGYAQLGYESSQGMLVLSRTSVVARPIPGGNASYALHLTVGGEALTVLAVHPRNPLVDVAEWRSDYAEIISAARSGIDGPLVIIGDLNAVPDHAPFRELEGLGLRDSASVAGTGWQPTYPAGRVLPTVLPIDHVLIGPGVSATATRTFQVTGADHRGLVADLSLEPSA